MNETRSDKKIVVIGGGTGIFPALVGLKKYFNNITAIVTMADDGGSTGILREEFGILPPGDIRRAIVALSESDNKILSELFNYRFQEGSGLSGHSFGNLMITALERITGSFDSAVNEAGKLLSVKGRVLPVTLKKTRLLAELENGKVVVGETNIDVPKHDGLIKINRVWLEPEVQINPAAKKAISEADAIVIGPGDLYTSLLPNLLVKGVKESLNKSKAKKIYFVNLMTKYGETNGFRASDFVQVMKKHLGEGVVDYVAINKTQPNVMRFKPYAAERSQFVEVDLDNFGDKPMPIVTDLLRKAGLIRHDPDKVAAVVKMLV